MGPQPEQFWKCFFAIHIQAGGQQREHRSHVRRGAFDVRQGLLVVGTSGVHNQRFPDGFEPLVGDWERCLGGAAEFFDDGFGKQPELAKRQPLCPRFADCVADIGCPPHLFLLNKAAKRRAREYFSERREQSCTKESKHCIRLVDYHE